MQTRVWLLASASLNAALLAAVVALWRAGGPGPAPDATHHAAPAKSASAPNPQGNTPTGAGAEARAPLALSELRDALHAAGVSPEVIRQVLAAELQRRRWREKRAASWWRGSPYSGDLLMSDPVEQQRRSEELRRLAGEPLAHEAEFRELDLSHLPEEKRAGFLRILRDYVEVSSRYDTDGLRLKADQDREGLLREEMQRDLRKLLTEEEYFEHTLRDMGSKDWTRLRTEAASLELTEQEFRDTARALRDARTLTDEEARQKAEERIFAELRERVGADRIFSARAKRSHDFQQLRHAQVRFGFSDAETESVMAAWKRAAQNAASLRAQKQGSEEKAAAWRALAEATRRDITAALGAEAASACMEQSMDWLRDWQRGADTRRAGLMGPW